MTYDPNSEYRTASRPADIVQDAFASAVRWQSRKAMSLRRTANAALRCDRSHPMDPLTLGNCQACALNGTRPARVSGWVRIFIQAHRPVTFRAIADALCDDNKAYANALARDLATFGHAGYHGHKESA